MAKSIVTSATEKKNIYKMVYTTTESVAFVCMLRGLQPSNDFFTAIREKCSPTTAVRKKSDPRTRPQNTMFINAFRG